MTPVRQTQVSGRDVVVYDGLVPADEVKRYFAGMSQAAFTRTESARTDSQEYRHWVCETPLANLPRIAMWAATAAVLTELRPNERYLPYRAYTNFAAYGDTLLTHVDALPDARELTALWFVCESWDPDWGGETLLYGDDGDAQIAVSPRPGRLLLFDGAIRHAGKPPNRNCTVARFTFAIKLRATA